MVNVLTNPFQSSDLVDNAVGSSRCTVVGGETFIGKEANW